MRFGIDLGGTKIEGIALAVDGREVARQRVATPHGGYQQVLAALTGLVRALEAAAGETGTVGVGTPGFLSPGTGLIRNSNLASLNGHAIDRDLAAALGRPVRVDNDANCFVLSEATDGAAANPGLDDGHPAVPVAGDDRGPGGPSPIDVVFGATLGTGVGGGIVVDGRVLNGANGSAAEWSHTTLPFLRPDETSPYSCPCGHAGCIESFISGRGLAGAYREATGQSLDAVEVGRRAHEGDPGAAAAFALYEERLARALAGVINLLDPRTIVLGGGVSNNRRLYANVPALWPRYTVADQLRTTLVQARHGDASGVRGAACLWPAR